MEKNFIFLEKWNFSYTCGVHIELLVWATFGLGYCNVLSSNLNLWVSQSKGHSHWARSTSPPIINSIRVSCDPHYSNHSLSYWMWILSRFIKQCSYHMATQLPFYLFTKCEKNFHFKALKNRPTWWIFYLHCYIRYLLYSWTKDPVYIFLLYKKKLAF